MSVLPNCVKCFDQSTKDVLPPCIHVRPPDNTGYPYDLAKVGIGKCAVDGGHYGVNADRVCSNYKGAK